TPRPPPTTPPRYDTPTRPPPGARLGGPPPPGAVAPGGALLVVGHDTTNLTEGVGGPQDPDVLFTPDDVLADLADFGLEAVRAERVRRPVETADGGTARAVDALVRLRRPRQEPDPASP
ncbi:hypothetical protein ACFW9F_21665, partial [Streptomyces sp. NPDC059506]